MMKKRWLLDQTLITRMSRRQKEAVQEKMRQIVGERKQMVYALHYDFPLTASASLKSVCVVTAFCFTSCFGA